jgi:hypothetical protein
MAQKKWYSDFDLPLKIDFTAIDEGSVPPALSFERLN